jgi:hypothetical protein
LENGSNFANKSLKTPTAVVNVEITLLPVAELEYYTTYMFGESA